MWMIANDFIRPLHFLRLYQQFADANRRPTTLHLLYEHRLLEDAERLVDIIAPQLDQAQLDLHLIAAFGGQLFGRDLYQRIGGRVDLCVLDSFHLQV